MLSSPPTTRPTGPPPRTNGNGAAASPKRDTPRLAVATPTFEPPRIVVNGVEGFGKTSLGAFANNPVMLMARGETGYKTLLGAGRVPAVPAVQIETWPETLAVVDGLRESPADEIGLVILDAMGGFERLCHEHVCNTDFSGVWGEKGFGSFQKGFDLSVNEWVKLLAALDRVRNDTGAAVLLLSHAQVKPFKNPLGPDYDRYVADCHAKTWAATARWADAVLFGNFVTVVEEKKGKRAKGIGGTDRAIYTERRDGYDAKNRYGMPETMDLPNDPAQMWPVVWSAIKGEQS
jgi:hypothetical protein